MSKTKPGLPELVRFAKKLGIEVRLGQETEFKSIPKTIQWIGSRKVVKSKRFVTLKLTVEQLISPKPPEDAAFDELSHELGHFIAAPKGRRYKLDYGIKVRSKFADIDEFKANFVEREIRQVMGRDYNFAPSRKERPEYKQAEDWWLSEGQVITRTLLEFLV